MKKLLAIRIWPLLTPLMLVMLGLLTGSWILPGQEKFIQSNDTAGIVDQLRKSPVNIKKSIITLDENGVHHEEIMENIYGDEDLVEIIPNPDFLDLGISGFATLPFEGTFNLLDTLPDEDEFYQDELDSVEQNLEAFGPHFEKMFNARFDKKIQQQLEKIQEEIGQIQLKFGEQWVESQQKLHGPLQEIQDKLYQELGKIDRLDNCWGSGMEGLNNGQQKMEEFKVLLKKELVKDGYLSVSDKIESISWGDSGNMKFNGVKIKSEHQAKYQELKRKFFDWQKRKGQPE